MTGDAFDLDAYLARIGYAGPHGASLPVLRAIIARHSTTIPFENIEVFARRGVMLDNASVQSKLVRGGRGGYCYEQNILLREALAALGFRVSGLMARVVRGMPDDAMTSRTHMLLRVDLDEGVHLADVGFGNLTPTAPLLLSPGMAQRTLHESYRLMPIGEQWLLQARPRDAWENIYRFPLQPQFQIDYEVANWFMSARPGSVFVENLVVARPGDACRNTLFNNRFTVRRMDGRVECRELTGVDEYRQVLADAFDLRLAENDLATLVSAAQQRATHSIVHPSFG